MENVSALQPQLPRHQVASFSLGQNTPLRSKVLAQMLHDQWIV